ncbi:metal-sensitive transcriptional regulator [Nocardioides flavus (ex Wang et al. 2016)]|uniref:metal-sensitive transcriptional regulator n=1 Tax=Nocardioides flavus (ex Wang et al. 2016) TaxID=2058780 RepID=UPI00174BC09D|nr:metal-sensitive transcriptional regulator [Nocardioides flavus (ex Wang et al. 2016)]
MKGQGDGLPGYITEKQAVLKRLRRIEGQIRGLERLVDEEQYCIDILTQVSAATKALEGVALLLLDQHLEHCLTPTTDPAEAEQKLNEASAAIRRLVRS